MIYFLLFIGLAIAADCLINIYNVENIILDEIEELKK
jgi:hypothetical protein